VERLENLPSIAWHHFLQTILSPRLQQLKTISGIPPSHLSQVQAQPVIKLVELLEIGALGFGTPIRLEKSFLLGFQKFCLHRRASFLLTHMVKVTLQVQLLESCRETRPFPFRFPYTQLSKLIDPSHTLLVNWMQSLQLARLQSIPTLAVDAFDLVNRVVCNIDLRGPAC
jgi:hypothetical protein